MPWTSHSVFSPVPLLFGNDNFFLVCLFVDPASITGWGITESNRSYLAGRIRHLVLIWQPYTGSLIRVMWLIKFGCGGATTENASKTYTFCNIVTFWPGRRVTRMSDDVMHPQKFPTRVQLRC
jgi:hypothetical protein